MSELIYSKEFLFQLLEVIAMTSALIYIFLAIRENNFCWWFGLMSSCIYVAVFTHAKLYPDALLNVFYAAMAIFGWWSWKRTAENKSAEIKISWLTNNYRFLLLIIALLFGGMMSYLFFHFSDTAFPILTSATSSVAIIATYLQARKKMENWILFLAVNATSMYVYSEQKLYITVFLYAVYAILSLKGWREWRKKVT